jgi:hypothetical protein
MRRVEQVVVEQEQELAEELPEAEQRALAEMDRHLAATEWALERGLTGVALEALHLALEALARLPEPQMPARLLTAGQAVRQQRQRPR